MRGLLVACALLAACGGTAVTVSPTPSATRATVTPSPVPSATASASPAPTTLSSAKGDITVKSPQPNARVTSPLTISGDASVFEAALRWRITDSSGRVLAQGIATASAGAPARGTYSVVATFTPPTVDTIGIVEVFDTSPKDGTIDEIVRVPVVITR